MHSLLLVLMQYFACMPSRARMSLCKRQAPGSVSSTDLGYTRVEFITDDIAKILQWRKRKYRIPSENSLKASKDTVPNLGYFRNHPILKTMTEGVKQKKCQYASYLLNKKADSCSCLGLESFISEPDGLPTRATPHFSGIRKLTTSKAGAAHRTRHLFLCFKQLH
jgi:hypothetical protein